MKNLVLFLLFGWMQTLAISQYAASTSGSTIAAAEINSKPTVQSSAVDAIGNCTVGKDIHINTAKGSIQSCIATNRWSTPTSLIRSVVTKAFADTGYVATEENELILVNAVAGATTIVLPACSSANDGRAYQVKKIDASANGVIIDGNASETIDGTLTVTIGSQWASLSMRCQGSTSAWFIY
jgi:hypothetical protein